jgi:hypothetical protein
MMDNIGRLLIAAGVIFVLVGGGVYLAARLGLPLGRLPGDIRIEGKGGGLYIPIVTCLAISLVLTLVLNLITRLLHK